MHQKIGGVLFIVLLLTTSIHAQQNYRVEPSPWAFSWGVGLGSMIPTGDLGDKFKGGFAADTELNLYYGKAFLMLNGGFASNALTGDIDVVSDEGTAVWPANSNALHAFVGGNIGVTLFEADQLSFYPYAGIGYGFIEPNLKTSQSDPVLSGLKLNAFLWNVGFGMDYNFPDKNYAPGEINRILKMGIRYQFQKPNHEKKHEGFGGATHWFTLRFVIGSSMPGKVVYY